MPSEPAAPEASALPRHIGGFTAGCVLVSTVVGSGIFTTTGFMARDLGQPGLILAVWLIGGLIALAGALAYSCVYLDLRHRISRGSNTWRTRRSTSVGCSSTLSIAVSSAVAVSKTAAASGRRASALWGGTSAVPSIMPGSASPLAADD